MPLTSWHQRERRPRDDHAAGSAWRNATAVLAPRVIRFSVNMNF